MGSLSLLTVVTLRWPSPMETGHIRLSPISPQPLLMGIPTPVWWSTLGLLSPSSRTGVSAWRVGGIKVEAESYCAWVVDKEHQHSGSESDM